MTTASDIIKAAYRENNLIPINRDPTDAEKAEALPRLFGVSEALFGTVLGQFLPDWPVPPVRTSSAAANYPLLPFDLQAMPPDVWANPPANVRLIAAPTAATTVYLQNDPRDGARVDLAVTGDLSAHPLTLNGNGRLIEGAAAVTLDANPTTRRAWLYRADLAGWVALPPSFELTSEMPLPAEFDDYFIIALCARLSGRQGKEVPAASMGYLADVARKIKQRYTQPTVNLTTYFATCLRTRTGNLQDRTWVRGDGGLYGG